MARAKIQLVLFGLIALQIFTVGASVRSRIIDGEDSTNSDYSFFAYVSALRFEFVGEGGGFFITQRHVVTSGRLIENFESWEIRYGSREFDSLISTTNVQKAEYHQNYSSGYYLENDIGLITLWSPIGVGTLSVSQDSSVPVLGSTGFFVGFGMDSLETDRSSVLQRANQVVVPQVDCGVLTSGELVASYTHFCARDPEQIAALCTGDFGGAMVDASGDAVGIALTSYRSCDPTVPVVFTKLSLFTDWLNERIN